MRCHGKQRIKLVLKFIIITGCHLSPSNNRQSFHCSDCELFKFAELSCEILGTAQILRTKHVCWWCVLSTETEKRELCIVTCLKNHRTNPFNVVPILIPGIPWSVTLQRTLAGVTSYFDSPSVYLPLSCQ